VKAKLQKESANSNDSVKSIENIENKINILDSNESSEFDDLNNSEEINASIEFTEENYEELAKRLNPFAYKSSAELRYGLSSKQLLKETSKLTRYSMNFYANENVVNSSALPTPDNYIISSGDTIRVHIYGDRDKEYSLEVNNNGNIDIEYIGPVKIAGLEYKNAKEVLISKLTKHFKQSNFNINMEKYSSIQVTLVGDVKHPGIYNVSSFSTAKDLLIVARGVRDTASVREILIKRNAKTIATIDFYDLLFKAKNITTTLLKHGDIIVIKEAKKLVTIDGFINHASIFELKSTETLSKLIEYAGGMKANASKKNIKVDRYANNSSI